MKNPRCKSEHVEIYFWHATWKLANQFFPHRNIVTQVPMFVYIVSVILTVEIEIPYFEITAFSLSFECKVHNLSSNTLPSDIHSCNQEI